MPISIQQSPKGPVFVFECGCCGRDVRVLTKAMGSFREAVKRWRGLSGCYNGKWGFICGMCVNEAATGEHVGGWRW